VLCYPKKKGKRTGIHPEPAFLGRGGGENSFQSRRKGGKKQPIGEKGGGGRHLTGNAPRRWVAIRFGRKEGEALHQHGQEARGGSKFFSRDQRERETFMYSLERGGGEGGRC